MTEAANNRRESEKHREAVRQGVEEAIADFRRSLKKLLEPQKPRRKKGTQGKTGEANDAS